MNTSQDKLLEEALATYPLAEVPNGFSAGVMRQIKPRQAAPKFRLTWVDVALGLFASSLPGVFFISWAFLPRISLLRLQYLLLQLGSPSFAPLIIVFLAVLVVLGLLALIASLRYLTRPQIAWH